VNNATFLKRALRGLRSWLLLRMGASRLRRSLGSKHAIPAGLHTPRHDTDLADASGCRFRCRRRILPGV